MSRNEGLNKTLFRKKKNRKKMGGKTKWGKDNNVKRTDIIFIANTKQ